MGYNCAVSGTAVPRWYDTLAAYCWRAVVIALAGLALVWLVVRLRLVFLPAFVALLLATLLAGPVGALKRRGLPPLAATWAVLIGTVVLLAGVVAVLVPPFISQLSDLGTQLQRGADTVLRWLAEGPLQLSREEIDSYLQRAREQLQANAGAITGGVLAGVTKTVEFLAGVLLAAVLTFFFLKDGERMWAWVVERFGEPKRTHVAELGRRAAATLTGYVRGVAIIALVDAVLIGAALLVVGNPLWLPLTVITFFGAFFPIVGAVVAGVVAALVTLVTNGFVPALVITGVIVVVQQVEGDVLQPVVMGRAVRLHPVVILLALTAGGILAGIAGAFVSVPLAAVAASAGNYLSTLERAGSVERARA